MIQLKQKTPQQIKKEKKFNQQLKSVIKTYIKKNKSSSNINFFNTDKTIYNTLKEQNQKKQTFSNHNMYPFFIISIISIIFILIILYFNFNNIIKSKSYTFIFIFLIVSLISIATFIILKFYLVDSKI
tara:strand:+ start:114 stop:497 length:384 start_codon:yes stop_codon:yes gene_type:complete